MIKFLIVWKIITELVVAGRDGKRAYAMLLYSNKELEDLQQQTEYVFPMKRLLKLFTRL